MKSPISAWASSKRPAWGCWSMSIRSAAARRSWRCGRDRPAPSIVIRTSTASRARKKRSAAALAGCFSTFRASRRSRPAARRRPAAKTPTQSGTKSTRPRRPIHAYARHEALVPGGRRGAVVSEFRPAAGTSDVFTDPEIQRHHRGCLTPASRSGPCERRGSPAPNA